MKVFSIAIILLSFSVHAEKQIKAKDMSLLGKIDESTLNKAQEVKPAPEVKPTSSSFSMSCKDSTGKEFKQGEVGYDSCLSGLKLQQDQNKKNSGLNKKNTDTGNSANFNFKIGE